MVSYYLNKSFLIKQVEFNLMILSKYPQVVSIIKIFYRMKEQMNLIINNFFRDIYQYLYIHCVLGKFNFNFCRLQQTKYILVPQNNCNNHLFLNKNLYKLIPILKIYKHFSQIIHFNYCIQDNKEFAKYYHFNYLFLFPNAYFQKI